MKEKSYFRIKLKMILNVKNQKGSLLFPFLFSFSLSFFVRPGWGLSHEEHLCRNNSSPLRHGCILLGEVGGCQKNRIFFKMILNFKNQKGSLLFLLCFKSIFGMGGWVLSHEENLCFNNSSLLRHDCNLLGDRRSGAVQKL